VMAAVKRDEWWSKKTMAWENFMGSGKNQAKSHFLKFLDLAGGDSPAPKREIVRWNGTDLNADGKPGRWDPITPGLPKLDYFEAALAIAKAGGAPESEVPRLQDLIRSHHAS
jgi:hypothetical protein